MKKILIATILTTSLVMASAVGVSANDTVSRSSDSLIPIVQTVPATPTDPNVKVYFPESVSWGISLPDDAREIPPPEGATRGSGTYFESGIGTIKVEYTVDCYNTYVGYYNMGIVSAIPNFTNYTQTGSHTLAETRTHIVNNAAGIKSSVLYAEIGWDDITTRNWSSTVYAAIPPMHKVMFGQMDYGTTKLYTATVDLYLWLTVGYMHIGHNEGSNFAFHYDWPELFAHPAIPI